MLACNKVTLEVAGRTLCRALEFTVKPGEVWGLLGPNGSGKTTLLNTLAGIASPARGGVTVNGLALASMSGVARARAIGVLPQHEETEFWGTVAEYVGLGFFPHGHAWFGWQGDDQATTLQALLQLDMADFAARRMATLSGGERQRVRMAQLYAQSPGFLLLDEPLQHLDLRYQMQLLKLVEKLAQEQARGIVMVLHDAWWPARVCTHALLLDGAGDARLGLADTVLTQSNLEALFGCALQPAGDKPQSGFVPAI